MGSEVQLISSTPRSTVCTSVKKCLLNRKPECTEKLEATGKILEILLI